MRRAAHGAGAGPTARGERMKLAYLTSMYPRATDSFIRREVLELRRLGHEVHTFSVRAPGDEHLVSDEVRWERAGTFYLLERPERVIGAWALEKLTNPLGALRAMWLAWRTRAPGLRALVRQIAYLMEAARLARRMRALGVQHLHNHIGENSATVAMLASAMSGVPYSLTIHGPGVFYAPQKWALGEKIRRSAFTACISDFCRSQCMVWTPHEAWGKLRVVRCGVGDDFLAGATGPFPSARRFVTVGRLCEAKGQALLIEAAARLAGEGADFELVLVGDGPLRGALEALIDRHGLRSRVRITGWMGADGVRREILAARAFVTASFAEGLPVVIMEALALGRPVLSTHIAGVPELVEQGVNGWLFPAGSVDALAAAMRDALGASLVRLEGMGRAGARRVAERHNAHTETARLAALFEAARDGGADTPGAEPRPVASAPRENAAEPAEARW